MPKVQPSLEDVTSARKKSNMDASRLEADILQTIIRHAQEHHTPVEVIILALGNSTKHWINHMVNTKITKKLYDNIK